MTRTYGQPWNKGRSVGARKALSQQDVLQIRTMLTDQEKWHDLCLFLVAIDSMLRASDLLRLRVCDVVDGNGNVKTTFPWRQKKTANAVCPVLTPTTQMTVLEWIVASNKQFQDYLFTREKPNTGEPISIGFYRTLIKRWVVLIGLSPEDYSAHSLRRTKAIFLYERGVSIEIIGRLLGHRSSASTIRYLGLDEAQARSAALDHDIFKASSKRSRKQTLSAFEITQIADQIWEMLTSRLPQDFPKDEK